MAGATHESARVLARVIAGVLALWAGAAAVPARGVDIYSESAVRAAFVLRFAGFVEWPAGAMTGDRFTIAVLGDEPLATDLAQLAEDRTLAGRAVRVVRIRAASQARDAQVLFVGAERRGDLRSILRAVSAQPLLVVTAEARALAAGSVINFKHDQGRVRFEISVPAAERMGLRISAELLAVAARVER